VSAAKLALGALLAAGVFAGALPAQAYCLTRGCNDETQDCQYDAQDCLITGPQLHWASSCVSFDVQRDGSAKRGLSYRDAHTAIRAGFAEWLSADCGGGVGPSIAVSDYGPVECNQAEYNQDAPNANIFMFRDDEWPYANALDTLALTTLIFNADSGEIYDADVEVNTFEAKLSVDRVGFNDIDFRSVITHEIGHFLGLSHSNVDGSTMERNYGKGQTGMASIEQDDIDGICAALPPERATASDSCEPRHSFGSECALPMTCQLAPGAPGGLITALLALAGISSTLLRRKLRRAAPRP
jgi:Matrixin